MIRHCNVSDKIACDVPGRPFSGLQIQDFDYVHVTTRNDIAQSARVIRNPFNLVLWLKF